ncbi:TPA: hypothetical protein RG418_002110 [Aeromonas hydrophila]|nr:hypothetical protein [Aeromonas hydrophila]
MELGVYDLRSAIEWYVNYTSNNEEFPNPYETEKLISDNAFPHLKYFYSQDNIDLAIINGTPKVIAIKDKNTSIIKNIPNDIHVETRRASKRPDEYIYLKNRLIDEGITLEEVIDIEFFERYESHVNYNLELTGEIESVYEKYSDTITNSASLSGFIRKTKSHRDLIKLLYRMEFDQFESIFMNESTSHLYDVLDDSGNKIDKSKFTAFLDTEKIHLQFAICSYGAFNKIPVLAYFGYGNYYPFSQSIKQKHDRLERFSQLNKGDDISAEYYLKEIKKPSAKKSLELKNKINNCQKKYYEHFNNNFNLEHVRKKHIAMNGNKNKYSPHIDSFMMLEPRIRTKSAALVAYDYPFYS